MFIRVTTKGGSQRLVNVDHVYCIAKNGEWSEIIYTDDTSLTVRESLCEIEHILKQAMKGADDEF